MKVYSQKRVAALAFILLALVLFVLVPYFFMDMVFLLIGIPLLLYVLILFKGALYTFVINERGITGKFLFRNIFIAWDEFKYIRVGELVEYQGRVRRGDFSFIMCFSKVPLKTVFIADFSLADKWFARPTKKHFFIGYRNGMLEEVLKYVDEARIKDVSRIKNNPAAEGVQRATTSYSVKTLERFNLKDNDFWRE